ncbi:unnamed protein product, partial [Staurois parvus]
MQAWSIIFTIRKPTMRHGMQPMLECCQEQGRTDNSWGPRAIGDHGAPVSLPTLKPHPKKPIKGTKGHLMGTHTDPGPSGSAQVPK